MRIHMLSIGTTGDVNPMILLGKELIRRGHSIQIAAFEPHGPSIQRAGIDFYRLPGDAHNLIGEWIKPGASPVTFLHRFEKSVQRVAQPLIDALMRASIGADALVLTYFGSIGYSIAEKLGIPCFQMHYYPMDKNNNVPLPIMPALPLGRTYNRLTYDLAYLAVGGLEYRYLHKWRKSQGMCARRIRTRPDYMVGGRPIPVLYAISPLILPRAAEWPENIHMVGFMQPDEAEPFTPSARLAAFLQEEPQPLYIGFGSMTSGDMGEALEIVLRTLRTLGLRAVLSKGWGGIKTGTLPDCVYLADYIPHSWLFEQVRATVHHGGAGTTAAGLRAGLPTLIVPFGGDQPFWGRRIYELGLGPKPVPRSQLTEQSLGEALAQLVGNPAYRTAAREMQRHLRKEDGAANAADVIEREIAQWTA